MNVQKQNPDLVLALGDYSYASTSGCWFDLIRPIGSITKTDFGNHDVENSGLVNSYLNNFGLSRQYYSYNIGNVHVLTISTEDVFTKGSQQYNFVLGDLQEANSDPGIKWVLVNMHVPLYASPNTCGDAGCNGDKNLRETYHHVFDKYGVDPVLEGHVHNYQRSYPIIYNSQNPSNPTITSCRKDSYSNPDGEVYIIVGTGGENFHGLSGKSYYTASQQDSKFGILDMQISANTLEAKFIDNAGSVLDRFTIDKNVNIKNIVTTSKTNCSPDNISSHDSGFSSVKNYESDQERQYYQVVSYLGLKDYSPTLPAILHSKSVGVSNHNNLKSDPTVKLKTGETMQTIKQRVSQKIEKKFGDLNLKFGADTRNNVDKKNTGDKSDKDTVLDSSWPIKSDIVKHKNKVDKSLISAISQNVQKNLEKRSLSKTFGSGFPFR